ncbi:hypothetical protein OG930_29535 [Streptomyces sp. NBC_01799]|nr:hypothetical protein OG930_29535 [Streptomyces sp. NBC_01799]
MTTTTQTPDRPAVPPLTHPEMGLAGVGALAAAGVGALGLIQGRVVNGFALVASELAGVP